MKIRDCKCKCGHDDFFFADNGNHTGIYCSYCGKWLKWANGDEQNLRMKKRYNERFIKEGYNQGVKDTIAKIVKLVNMSDYPEDLEMNLLEYLKEKGVRI